MNKPLNWNKIHKKIQILYILRQHHTGAMTVEEIQIIFRRNNEHLNYHQVYHRLERLVFDNRLKKEKGPRPDFGGRPSVSYYITRNGMKHIDYLKEKNVLHDSYDERFWQWFYRPKN